MIVETCTCKARVYIDREWASDERTAVEEWRENHAHVRLTTQDYDERLTRIEDHLDKITAGLAPIFEWADAPTDGK